MIFYLERLCNSLSVGVDFDLSESKMGRTFCLVRKKYLLKIDENIKLLAKQAHGILQLTQTDGLVENKLYLTPEDQEKNWRIYKRVSLYNQPLHRFINVLMRKAGIMEITYTLTEEDYLKFNLYHIKHSETGRRALSLQRFVPPLLFIVL